MPSLFLSPAIQVELSAKEIAYRLFATPDVLAEMLAELGELADKPTTHAERAKRELAEALAELSISSQHAIYNLAHFLQQHADRPASYMTDEETGSAW